MSWLERLIIRQNPAVAPRADPPPAVEEAKRDAARAAKVHREVVAREPTIREVVAELRTARMANHIPERIRASMRGRPA